MKGPFQAMVIVKNNSNPHFNIMRKPKFMLAKTQLILASRVNFVCHCMVWSNSTLTFVVVLFFGHFQLLTFVTVIYFRSYSNQNLVIFIRSCELASIKILTRDYYLMLILLIFLFLNFIARKIK